MNKEEGSYYGRHFTHRGSTLFTVKRWMINNEVDLSRRNTLCLDIALILLRVCHPDRQEKNKDGGGGNERGDQ